MKMGSDALELASSEGLEAANYSAQVAGVRQNLYLLREQTIEGTFLMFIAAVGIFLNSLVFSLALFCGPLRKWLSGFAMHGCILEITKSAFCIPFSLTLLNSNTPPYCASLGTAYIIIQTASMFNLLGMVLAEAYTFHVHNMNEKDADGFGAMMCFLFGVLMIYIGSMIVHLGPTFIGGELRFNQDIGNCLYAYGEIKNYIVQVMWIGITTITNIIILRYFLKFFLQLKANGQFRITALARNAAAMSKGEGINESIYDVVYRLKRRVKVLFAMVIINMICWYPLYILTLVDYKYEKPRYLYRIFTIFAWSHCALTPLPLLTFDKSFGIWWQVKGYIKDLHASNANMDLETKTPLVVNAVRSNDIPKIPAANNKNSAPVQNHTSPAKPTPRPTPKVLRKADSVQSAPPASSYGSCKNSPSSIRSNRTNVSVYDKVNAELLELGTKLPAPICHCDTVESRINLSRETDLLFDFKIDRDDSIGDLV